MLIKTAPFDGFTYHGSGVLPSAEDTPFATGELFESTNEVSPGTTDMTVVESTFIPPFDGLNWMRTGVTPSTHEMPYIAGYPLSSFFASVIFIMWLLLTQTATMGTTHSNK